MPKRYVYFSLFCLFLSSVNAAEFKIYVNKQQLTQNEYLTLTFQLINSDIRLRAEGIDPNIDLTRLNNDFDVGSPKSTFRYRTERTHGRATSEISVELFPKQIGTLRIPSFIVDGFISKPITIQSLAPKETAYPEVFTETGFLKKDLWQGEPSLLYLDLFSRVALKTASFGGQLDSQPLDIYLKRLPEAQRTEVKEGISYQVTRKRWSITPRQAQTYTFYLPDLWVETASGKRQRFPVKIEKLAVKALPENVAKGIIIGEPTLTQNLPTSFIAGELFTWSIDLTANAPPNQLANILRLPAPIKQGETFFHGAVKKTTFYKEGKLLTTATYSLSSIPQHAGSLKLPDISIPYLDVKDGSIKQRILIGKNISVSARTASSHKIMPQLTRETPPQETMTAYAWKIATVFFIGLWLGTLLLFKQKKSRFKHSVANRSKKMPQPSDSLKNQLLQLLGSHDIESGLKQWTQRYGVYPLLNKVARNIQQHLYGKTTVNTKDLKHELSICHKTMEKIRRQTSLAPESDRSIMPSPNEWELNFLNAKNPNKTIK